MRLSTLVVGLAICGGVIGLAACGDDDSGSGTHFDQPYDIEGNIPGDAINVTLAGDGTGSVVLPLIEPLPTPESGDDQELLALLLDGTISVTVQDQESTSYTLTSGTLVMGVPSAPGEYSLSLDEARAVLTIRFYNETTTGASLQAGQAYTVWIEVTLCDWFSVTNTPIVRTVTVN
jgi:hypothetical protein